MRDPQGTRTRDLPHASTPPRALGQRGSSPSPAPRALQAWAPTCASLRWTLLLWRPMAPPLPRPVGHPTPVSSHPARFLSKSFAVVQTSRFIWARSVFKLSRLTGRGTVFKPKSRSPLWTSLCRRARHEYGNYFLHPYYRMCICLLHAARPPARERSPFPPRCAPAVSRIRSRCVLKIFPSGSLTWPKIFQTK